MASDLENKQFLDNEIRPFIKDKLPAILETIKALNNGYMEMRKRIAAIEKAGASRGVWNEPKNSKSAKVAAKG